MNGNLNEIIPEIGCFDNGTEVREYHVMLHVSDSSLNYSDQLAAINHALTKLLRNELAGAKIIFKRYFLSDAYNQADNVITLERDHVDYAISIIQQPPLDGTKIALWVVLQTGVTVRRLHSGLHETVHGK